MAVHTPYRPREQRRAAGILAGLVLGALVLWGVAMATTGSQTVEPELFGSADLDAAPPADSGTDAESGDGAGGTDDAEAGGGTDGQADGGERDDAGDGEAAPSDDEEDTDPAADEDPADEDPADEDGSPQPIGLEGGEAAWVAIVASVSGDEISEEAARDRLAPGQQLLWSSQYPSLNPGLWVIVEGPFDTEGAARQAARRIGGGAYPRALTEDAGDRYCALADGCSG